MSIEDVPGEHRPDRRSVERAVYGLILTASVIGVGSEVQGQYAAEVAAWVGVTLLVFWLAHVYSHVIGGWVETRRAPGVRDVGRAAAAEWPMVSACGIPLIVLLLGASDVIDDGRSIDVALIICLVELVLVGVVAARQAKASGPAQAVSGVVVLVLGLGIIFLKNLVH